MYRVRMIPVYPIDLRLEHGEDLARHSHEVDWEGLHRDTIES